MHLTQRTKGHPTVAVRPIVALIVVAGLALSGCDSFLDVNENPNAPQSSVPDVGLPGILANFSNGVIGSWPAKMSAEWTQQLSYNRDDRGLAEYDRYEMRDEDADALWEAIYPRILNEAKDVLHSTEANEEWAYHAMTKVMYAWTLSVATDMWGPVPLRDALNPEIREPRYDEQVAVYDTVQRLLAEAVEEFDRPNFPIRIPGNNDLLYGGDLNQWIRLANTLSGMFHVQLMYAPGEDTQARAQAALEALEGGFRELEHAAIMEYSDNSSGRAQHPWNIARVEPGFRVSAHLIDLLTERDDPRLPIIAEPAETDGVFRGHPNSGPAGPDEMYSRPADHFVADTLFSWVSLAEARFLEAEARLAVGGAAAADEPYRAGIQANMERLGVDTLAAEAYLADRPALSTVADPLAEIMREKYVANFLKYQAWNDWRRTGHPEIDPVGDGLLQAIPQRFPWPESEVSHNGTRVQETGIASGLDGMLDPVWWATGGAP